MEAYLDRQGVQVRRKIELTSNEAVKQAVLAGLGISIIPLIGIKNELQNGSLRIVPSPRLPVVTHHHYGGVPPPAHSPRRTIVWAPSSIGTPSSSGPAGTSAQPTGVPSGLTVTVIVLVSAVVEAIVAVA